MKMAQFICQMMLKRIGEAEYQLVEIAHRTTVPGLRDIVEVPVEKKRVRGRVVHVASPPPDKAGTFRVDLDEVAP